MDIRQILSLGQALEVDGIYIYEIDPPKYIKGRTSSIVGIVGEFERGPVGEVVRIGSAKAFRDTFGGYGVAPAGEEDTWDGFNGFKAVVGKLWPAGLRIVRPVYTDQLASAADIDLVTHVPDPLTQGRTITLTAKYKGAYGNRITATVNTASDTSLTNGFRLTITLDGESQTVDNLTAAMTTAEVTARFAAAGVTLVTAVMADDAAAVKASWPATSTLSGGAEGTTGLAAWTDAIDLLLANREISILFASEPPDAVAEDGINAYIKSAISPAGGAGVPVVAVLQGDAGDTIATAAIEAALYRSDRIVYTWPWRKQVYAGAASTHESGKVVVPSNDVVAAALAAIGPDHDVSGPEATSVINAATVGLELADITRDDYVTANAQGICALEFDPDLGFRVRTPIVTDLTPGKELVYRRRMADYLEWSIAAALKYFAGQPMTEEWQDEVVGAITGFLDEAQRQNLLRNYSVDIESVNTDLNLAKGVFYILMKVQLFGIARSIVLMSQIGASVEITELDQTA